MRFRSLTLITALALLAGLWFSATTRAQEEPARPKALRPAAAGDARVRIVHGSADAGPVDVYVNDNRVLTNIPLGTVSDYLDVPAGVSVRLRVVPAGGLPSAPAIDVNRSFISGQYYTIAACGTVAGGTLGNPCVAENDFGTPIPAGQARVRVFHFAPDAPTPVDLTADGIGVIVNDVGYRLAPGVADVPVGTYTLGLTNGTGSTVLTTIPGVQLLGGRTYDVFAVGSIAGGTFKLVNSVSDVRAKVRVVHAAVGAPAVDVYVGGAKVLSNISFFQASDYLSVAAGTVQVYVTLTGQTTPLITPVNLVLEPGKAYTVAARGDLSSFGSLGYQQYLDDLSAPPAGQAKVRAIHLSPDAPAVALRANGATLPVAALSYPNASSYVAVPAAVYNLQAVVASGPSTGAVAITLPLVNAEAGRIYDVFAIDSVARIRGEIRVTDTQARVRVVHASPTAGPVDVYVDGAKVLSGVTVGQISEYLRVPAGLRRVQVAPAGAAITSAVIDVTLTFEANEAYTVAARNQGASVAATVFTDEQGVAGGSRAKVRVYHLSSVAPTVDVRVAGTTTPLINDLQPGTASVPLEIDAGTYNLEVTDSSGAALLLTVPNVRVVGRINYDLFAIDGTSGPTVVAAQSLAQDLPIYTQFLPLTIR